MQLITLKHGIYMTNYVAKVEFIWLMMMVLVNFLSHTVCLQRSNS